MPSQDKNYLLQETDIESDFYVVEKIIGRRKKKQGYQYLVKWKGYSQKQATWENQENLKYVKELIDQFKHKKRKFKQDQTRKQEKSSQAKQTIRSKSQKSQISTKNQKKVSKDNQKLSKKESISIKNKKKSDLKLIKALQKVNQKMKEIVQQPNQLSLRDNKSEFIVQQNLTFEANSVQSLKPYRFITQRVFCFSSSQTNSLGQSEDKILNFNKYFITKSDNGQEDKLKISLQQINNQIQTANKNQQNQKQEKAKVDLYEVINIQSKDQEVLQSNQSVRKTQVVISSQTNISKEQKQQRQMNDKKQTQQVCSFKQSQKSSQKSRLQEIFSISKQKKRSKNSYDILTIEASLSEKQFEYLEQVKKEQQNQLNLRESKLQKNSVNQKEDDIKIYVLQDYLQQKSGKNNKIYIAEHKKGTLQKLNSEQMLSKYPKKFVRYLQSIVQRQKK